MLNFVQVRSFKNHCKFLEWSAHGVVWMVVWLAFFYVTDDKNLYQMQVNFFIGLLIDIFLVAIIKAIVRRRRPSLSDDPFCVGPDVYSFPSGHASRGTLIFCFFTSLYPLSMIFWPPLFAWVVSLLVSRLLLYRHHILDLIGGVLLGIVEAFIVGLVWMNQESCLSLVGWMTDEKIAGAEV